MTEFYNDNIPWELIGKVLAGVADRAEQDIVDNWAKENTAHQNILEEIISVWENSANYQIAFLEAKRLDTTAAWAKVQLSIETETRTVKKTGFIQIYSKRIAAAAAVLILLTVSAYWAMPYITGKKASGADIHWLAVSNELKEPKAVQMPDGSSIVLNAGTSLRYPDRFEPRLIELSGEAYFEVEHDPKRPFEVRFGKENSVKVLGTTFNIRAYKDEADIAVTVNSGKVAFKVPAKDEIYLQAGDAVNYNVAKAEIQKISNPNATAWKTNVLDFENTELGEILSVLERHYRTKFEVKNNNILHCRFKGTFEQKSLETVLEAISFGLELNIEVKNNVYYIDGQGCEVN